MNKNTSTSKQKLLYLIMWSCFVKTCSMPPNVTYKKININKDLKLILLWTKHTYIPILHLGQGQKTFTELKCPVNNCFVISSPTLFRGDITKFDAISFDVNYLHDNLVVPQQRKSHQKYIFFSMEPPAYHPVCSEMYENFFNWTYTYKLDSDIVCNYIQIKNAIGEIVGPSIQMGWIKNMDKVSDKMAESLESKSKAAAWFVNRCDTKNGREVYIKNLHYALKAYNLTVDIYGSCGNLTCPNNESCTDMLKRDYYFYMAFEDSFAEDYVTEKLLTALNSDTVPIVYGGADYDSYLPPGSYINARDYKPRQLALLMHNLMKSPHLYLEFFRWRNHYKYSDNIRNNACNFCAALNNEEMLTTSVHMNFREWWHPNFEDTCSREKRAYQQN